MIVKLHGSVNARKLTLKVESAGLICLVRPMYTLRAISYGRNQTVGMALFEAFRWLKTGLVVDKLSSELY